MKESPVNCWGNLLTCSTEIVEAIATSFFWFLSNEQLGLGDNPTCCRLVLDLIKPKAGQLQKSMTPIDTCMLLFENFQYKHGIVNKGKNREDDRRQASATIPLPGFWKGNDRTEKFEKRCRNRNSSGKLKCEKRKNEMKVNKTLFDQSAESRVACQGASCLGLNKTQNSFVYFKK